MKKDMPFGVGVIVIKDGRILCGKRSDNGQICGPGGHIQFGEKPIQAALRESYEEFGIRPTKLTKVGALSNGRGLYKPSIVFLCSDFTGDIKSKDGEMGAAYWADLQELGKADLFPVFADSLELLENRFVIRADGGPGSGNHHHAGIPGQQGGSAPSGGSRFEANNKSVDTRTYDDDLGIPKNVSPCKDTSFLTKIENDFESLSHEAISLIDREGKEIYTDMHGEDDHVDLPGDYNEQAKGSIVTHYHSTGGTFSYKDIKSAVRLDLYAVRAVTPHEVYQLRKIGEGKKDRNNFAANYKRAYNKLRKDCDNEFSNIGKKYHNGEINREEGIKLVAELNKRQRRGMSEWLLNHAGEYGYEYTKDSK